MSQVVFVVDLARCTGCHACRIACKDRADLPDELEWLRVEAHEAGVFPKPSLTYRVVHCFHCAEPPCAAGCPVEAILKAEDGLVSVNAAECIGCEACIVACPFGAMVWMPDGAAAKCDGCGTEIAVGWEPTCVRACPMRALAYKDGTRQAIEETLRARGREIDQRFDDHGVWPGVIYLV